MRFSIAALAGLFLSALLIGCGGTHIPNPPANAKVGAPPPDSDSIAKSEDQAKAKAKADAKAKKK